MKAKVFFIFFFALFVSNKSFCESISVMQCEWNIPDRFVKKGFNLWVSQAGKMAYFHFKDEYFDKQYIESAVEPSNLEPKIFFSGVDNNYEILVYAEFSPSGKAVFPLAIVVKNQTGKGVFYMNGLEPNETVRFVEHCMPHVKSAQLEIK